MGDVGANVTASAAAETSGGEEKDESDDGEARDDHRFLDATPSDRESRIYSDRTPPRTA